MSVLWKITDEKVRIVINKIVEVAQPRKLILFGSYANRNIHMNSDLDILVVTRHEIDKPRKESVRIRSAVKGVIMSMDILVVSESKLKILSKIPGLIYREALQNGKVVYESTK